MFAAGSLEIGTQEHIQHTQYTQCGRTCDKAEYIVTALCIANKLSLFQASAGFRTSSRAHLA